MLCYVSSNLHLLQSFFFFFNDTPTTWIYTLSLHDALPIFGCGPGFYSRKLARRFPRIAVTGVDRSESQVRSERSTRSEEHTSELQSRVDLVCRLLLEKKKKK